MLKDEDFDLTKEGQISLDIDKLLSDDDTQEESQPKIKNNPPSSSIFSRDFRLDEADTDEPIDLMVQAQSYFQNKVFSQKRQDVPLFGKRMSIFQNITNEER